MRIVIADDEPVGLQRLELALSCIPDTTVVACARDGDEAMRLITQFQPDVVLLDIRMPFSDGMSVAERVLRLPNVPEIIFVTAHDEYAVRAFELHVADYLLKPASFERIREAVRGAASRLVARKADERFAQLERIISALREPVASSSVGPPDCFWVSTRQGLTRLPVDAIDLIEAEGDYAAIWSAGHRHMVKDTMHNLEAALDQTTFVRVHRSSIVNLARVHSVRRRGSRGYYLVLADERRIDVGQSYAQGVLDRLRAGGRGRD